jgi:tetratricopeptide (TPR) repeat protein
MIRPLRTALLSCVVTACALGAAGQAPDVGEMLAQARAAWHQGDALERSVRDALAGASGDYAKLLQQQDAAYEKAQKVFREALAAAPGDPRVPAEFGRFWLARREFGQARKMLEAALADKPPAAQKPAPAEEADIRRTLGGILERAGESPAALDHYRKAFALDNTNARNRLSLAVALCAAGQPRDAAQALKPWGEAAPNAPDFAAASAGVRALGLYTLGLAQEETGLVEDALQSYRKAEALATQGGIADTTGVGERAGAAVARLEDSFDAQQKRIEQRQKENEERKKKNLPPLPDERETYSQACGLCEQGCSLKNAALADASFVQAVAQARGNAAVQSEADALAKHASFDAFQAAMQAFQDSIVKCSTFWRPYYELAACNVMLGRLGTARKLLNQAAGCNPNNIAVLSLQGEVLLELGQWEDAAHAFGRLAELEPESGRANLGLARTAAGSQASAAQCRAGQAALFAAARLGVRDRRMVEVDERLTELAARFDRGEKPAAGPVIRGSGTSGRSRPADTLDPWRGSLIGK